MKNYTQIWEKNEEQYTQINEIRFNNFIELFKYHLDEKTRNAIFNTSYKFQNYIDVFYYIHNFIYLKYPNYIETFYAILQNLGYNFFHEIEDHIFLAARATEEDKERTIKTLEQSPFIEKLSIVEGKITIDSQQLGLIKVDTIESYFKNNHQILNYLKTNDTARWCHTASLELLSLLPEGKLITILAPHYFEGTYYHTIVQDKYGKIIDTAKGVVYDKDTFCKIYNGFTTVSVTNKEDIEEVYSKAFKNANREATTEYPALLIALHNQSVNLEESKNEQKTASTHFPL